MALSEFVLTEFYLLLRNPAVLAHRLTAPEAVGVIQSYRQHPRWLGSRKSEILLKALRYHEKGRSIREVIRCHVSESNGDSSLLSQ